MTKTLDSIVNQAFKRTMTAKKKYEEILYTTDHHYPFVSDEMKKIEKNILEEEQPKYHVLGGDWIDASGLSSFDPKADYIRQTQDEIDGFVHYLADLHEASPKTKRILIYGNHDYSRLERAKAESPFGVATLRVLNFQTLFKEAAKHYEREIGDVEFHKEYIIGGKDNGILFLHGDKRIGGQYQRFLRGGVTGARRNVVEVPFKGQAIIMGHRHRRWIGSHPGWDREVHVVPAMMNTEEVCYEPHSNYENGLAWIKYSPNSRPKPVFHIENKKMQGNGDLIINGKVYNGRR